jgi:hypothetical protein
MLLAVPAETLVHTYPPSLTIHSPSAQHGHDPHAHTAPGPAAQPQSSEDQGRK